ncbi:MAG: ShlB/FhaC/HecB family hemolysin secretion/activation protein [Proteobacteria bacterium]|nr:ShlB/FhaC/HecB family hemolysin secretion/activation protein [Pseudomonadota bacterium]
MLACCLALSPVLAEEPAPGPGPAAAPERLDILEFRVLGNSVLPARTIETAVYPHLGPARSFQDIEEARLALETAYHEAGFGTVYVDIPEQRVDGGIVRLRATEGRVHAVRVAGARYFSGREIRSALPSAAPGTVPSVPALQAELAAVNAESADRSVVPVLKAGPVPGTVDLELNVEDHLPLHLAAEVNNQYSADTRPLRASLTADYANLFGRLDSLSAQYQASPQQAGNVGVLAVAYARRLDEAAHLTFNYINSSSSVASLGSLDVVGKGHMYGLRYDRNVVAAPGHLETVSVGFDYKRFDQTVNAGLGATVATPISYGLLSTSYAGTVVAPRRVWTWSVGAGLVLRGVGSGPSAFDDKCYACRQTEFALHGEASVTQSLGGGFSLVFRGAAQLAPDPLVSNEQFLIGGAQTVRGYYEAEELGDVGYRSTVELQAPNLFGAASLHVRPFLFGDRGRIRTLAPLSGQVASSRLASAGAGLNFDWTRALGGNLTWARTLEPGTRTPDGDSRWMFVVRSLW